MCIFDHLWTAMMLVNRGICNFVAGIIIQLAFTIFDWMERLKLAANSDTKEVRFSNPSNAWFAFDLEVHLIKVPLCESSFLCFVWIRIADDLVILLMELEKLFQLWCSFTLCCCYLSFSFLLITLLLYFWFSWWALL